MTSRPSETIAGTVGTVLGALLILYGALHDGFDFTDLQDPEVSGAITLLVGLVSGLVTYFVAKRQRDPTSNVSSADDGSVVKT